MLKMVRHFVFADPLVEKVFEPSNLLLREEEINNELKKHINNEPGKKNRENFKISRNTAKNKIKMGVFNIPHPDKVLKGGEDAFCVREGLMAIADGVGSWSSQNVDPAVYSNELCFNIGNLYDFCSNQYRLNPKSLLMDAAQLTKSKGSSTCLIIALDKDQPLLHTSYIGDSGFIILRKNTKNNGIDLIYKSEEQCKSFNFPYQIGSIGDHPSVALRKTFDIQNNDIIIAGSDGLFDNLSTELIINCIKPFLEHGEKIPDIKLVAETVATLAYDASQDKTFKSIFAEKARKNNIQFSGGKKDDITVIAGQVEVE